MIKAIIMAGGKGTRLRPLTYIRPKPMIPLVNKPIMQYMIESLKSSGFDDQILALNYMFAHIKNYFKDGSDIGVNISYSIENWPLGTGGSVKKAKKYIDDTFFVISGDVISDVNFDEVLKFHKKKGALATLVLNVVDDPVHFGIAVLDDEGRITDYLEKPSPHEVFSNLANTGIYVFDPEIFDFLDGRRGEVDFSKHVFPRLIRENAGIYGYKFDGYWNDVGRPETYLKATYDILEGKLKLNLPGARIKEEVGKLGKIWTGENVDINEKVRIEGPVLIGENCVIEEGCRISRGTVIGDNVFLKRNVNVEGAVLFSNSFIDENSFLKGCILDTKCFLHKNSVIESGAVVGSFVEIGSGSILKSSRYVSNNVKIVPNSVIDSDYLIEAE